MLCSFQSTKVRRQRLLLKSHPVAQSTNFEGKEPSKLNSRLILPRKDITEWPWGHGITETYFIQFWMFIWHSTLHIEN